MRISSVLIIANGVKKGASALSKEIGEYIKSLGISVSTICTKSGEEELSIPVKTDLVITLGGDGTVL